MTSGSGSRWAWPFSVATSPVEPGPGGGLVDQVLGVLAAQRVGELDHLGFGHHQAAVELQVGPHAVGVHSHAVHDDQGLGQRAAGEHGELGDDLPFDLPFAGGPLVPGLLGPGQRGCQRPCGTGEADDHLGGDRVDLLRHGRGGAAVGVVGLEDLADLGAGQVDDVAGELGAGGGDGRAQPAELGDAVAVDVPGQVGRGEPEQLGNRAADLG